MDEATFRFQDLTKPAHPAKPALAASTVDSPEPLAAVDAGIRDVETGQGSAGRIS